MDILTIILILGIVQGFYIGLIMLTKRSGHQRADRIGGLLFFCFSISIIHFVFVRLNLYPLYPQFLGVSFPFTLFFGPLCYLYFYQLIHKAPVKPITFFLHSIPVILVILGMMPMFLMPGEAKMQRYYKLPFEQQNSEELIFTLLQVIQLSVYLFYTHKEVKAYRKKLPGTVANMENINLTYIYVGVYAFIIIFGFTFILLILAISGYKLGMMYMTWMPVLVPVSIYVTGYFSLRQGELADVDFIDQENERAPLPDPVDEDFTEKKQRLTSFMEEKRLFLDNHLSIQQLADATGMTLHELSRLINEGFKQNFYDFVNSYRVEEAKRKLSDPLFSPYTILAIAEESGFNSKSAFNSAFRKFAGMTPREFRAQNSPLPAEKSADL